MSTPQGKMPKSGADPDKNGDSNLSARTTAAKTARRIHKKTDPPVEVPSGRRRASCDFCTKRKRKCNGDGVNRCSFCIAKKQPKCHYGIRLLTGPRAGSKRASAGIIPNKLAKATAPSARGKDGSDGGGGCGGNISERRHSRSLLPLKRARLSPSPATGLVGIRESVYIAEYFQVMSFLPCTNESFIRKAMVRAMFPGRSAGGGFFGEEEEKDGWEDGTLVSRGAGPGDAIECAAGACVLWCTVAVGCLIGGRPKSSVDGYACRAREALSGCFDDGSVESARAFTAMALLQDFRGDERKSSKYIDFAKSIMGALSADEVPTDLTDAHMLFKARDMFDGFSDQLSEEDVRDAMGAVSGLVKEPRPLLQSELCRWLLKTHIRSLVCFSMDMQNTVFVGDESKAGVLISCSEPESESDGDGIFDLTSKSPPGVVNDEVPPATAAGLDTPAPSNCWRRPLAGTLAELPLPGPMSLKFAAQVLPDIKLMMHVPQSPEVCDGVGELCFWRIVDYVGLIQGQPTNTLYGVLRCTDIFVKNPGICRFTSWKHLAHFCLAHMVISGNLEEYEKLRTSYNSVLDSNDWEAPPFEEFHGTNCICGNTFCMSMYSFMADAALKDEPCYLRDDGDGSVTSEDETKLPPKMELQDVETEYFSSVASGESWAGWVSGTRRQPTATEAASEKDSPSPGAAAVAGVAAAPVSPTVATPTAASEAAEAALRFVKTLGGSVGNEQHPRRTGGACRFGQRVKSVALTPASSVSKTSSISDSAWPVSAGDAAAATVALSTAEGQDGDGFPDQQGQQAGGEAISSPLLPSVPSAQSSNHLPGGLEGQQAGGEAISSPLLPSVPSAQSSKHLPGGLELLLATEREGARATGLLDAVDELLGEAALQGFGEGDGDDNMLLYFDGNV